MSEQATIFVSIASYRDSECPATLADLFARADNPRRVSAGVLWQLVPGEDDDTAMVPQGVPAQQLRGIRAHASESFGPCWARHRIQRELWGGEDFYLQVDSHMRFSQGWDTRLLRMMGHCGTSRAVLATYPATYVPPDRLGPAIVPVLEAKEFDEHGILRLRGRPLAENRIPPRPIPGAFVSGGFLFAHGSVVSEVPYDPGIYFYGEEISMAARLWTHGYDIYSPNEHVLYHDYTTDRARPRHWSDHRDWSTLNRRSIRRVLHLLGMEECSDPLALVELEQYGLGSQRSLRAFEQHADIDFAARQVGRKTAQAGVG